LVRKGSTVAQTEVSKEGMAGCVEHAEKFLKKPSTKHMAIERAMDHCALDKKVDDANFVCPHYRDLLTNAFRREDTTKTYTATSFCSVAERYVSELTRASKVPNMGTGNGFEFELSKDCKAIVKKSMGPKKTLPAGNAPDFWYALCMNQDCAHFLPSRTRWCSHDHQPTHSASVCDAVRLYAADEASVFGAKALDADEVCKIYDEFVEETHINVEAYMHVVHGKEEHPVPSPDDKTRALESAKMKHQAKKNVLRDSSGEPVKSAAATQAAAALIVAIVSAVAF